jgi:hypothetical protein
MEVVDTPYFIAPINSSGVGPIMSQTTDVAAPNCMTKIFGKLSGGIDHHVYCLMQHHPGASLLPDGAKFGWTYNILGNLSEDVVHVPLYEADDIDMIEANQKGSSL